MQGHLATQRLLSVCNEHEVGGMPLMQIFFFATFCFQPIVMSKVVTVVMYWLGLYMGGRAWELRPRKGANLAFNSGW